MYEERMKFSTCTSLELARTGSAAAQKALRDTTDTIIIVSLSLGSESSLGQDQFSW